MKRPIPSHGARLRACAGWLACALLAPVLACRADVSLPSLFSDNMVLQQHSKIYVWGKADPHETVTVQLGPDSAQVTAGKDGNWSVKLDGIKAGGPYDLTVYGKNSVTVRNVAIGDVWLCAGESNMEFKVMAAKNAREEMAEADLPMVRLFNVKHNAAEKPQASCEGSWVVCDPDTVKDFPAVGYFFARELNRGMRVPIGIVETAWGPSPAEAWTPRETLENNPTLHAALDRYDKATAAYPAALATYQSKLAAWKAAPDGSPAPISPLPPGGQREPSALYNGMINPLLRFPIRGVLWYQGETDTRDPQFYRQLFPALITSWRKAWDAGNIPFLYAQLSGFMARRPEPAPSRWAQLREAQAAALDLPKTGMAVTVDLGEEHNMHPPDKQDVAHRFALLAENQAYGKEGVITSGPVFDGMEIQDGKAVISFSHSDGGLTGAAGSSGPTLKGFQIAGSDRKFVWADAAIKDDKVIVQSKDVAQPVAVRYAWADFPDCDLYNKAGLPAAPFRTDDWIAGQSAAAAASPSPAATPVHHHRHRHQS